MACPRLVAIFEHMEKFYNGHSYSIADFKSAKKTFSEEFWFHAPNELKYWKEKVLEDPINHRTITKYDILLKTYKYQLQHPLYRFPTSLKEKINAQKTVCAHVTQTSWGNFD